MLPNTEGGGGGGGGGGEGGGGEGGGGGGGGEKEKEEEEKPGSLAPYFTLWLHILHDIYSFSLNL